jgi:hypothetical protein
MYDIRSLLHAEASQRIPNHVILGEAFAPVRRGEPNGEMFDRPQRIGMSRTGRCPARCDAPGRTE